MHFAYPAFLWALAALAIPVIIHLFNFRRTTRIYFSNTRFLNQIRQETTQQRRLKQYLVLASRLLFVFFLVMTFAQPFLPATDQLNAGREVEIYLDNSYSMLSNVGEKTRALDAGIRFAQEIVNLFPADTRYRLLTNDFAPFSNTYKTKGDVLDLLTQVRLSPVSRSYADIVQRLGTTPADVYWISDFQKSTMGEITPATDSLRSWRLVPIRQESYSNVLVDSVYLDDPFVVGGQRNALNVRLKNAGNKRRDELVLRLTINDIQSGTASISLEANATGVARFDLEQGLTGRNRAVISFTDFPVSFDNEFYVSLNFSDKIRVVEVRGKNTFVEKVFGNAALFSYKAFSPGNVDLAVLSQADLIVLNGLEELHPSLQDAVTRHAQGSGNVLVIPSARPLPSAIKSLFRNISLTDVRGTETLEMEKPDFQNPFFENVFEEQSPAMAMPHAMPVIDGPADRSAILKFKGGKPFLIQSGSAFLLTSPLEPAFTDFQNHALFVPVMYRIAASGHRSTQKPYYSLAESTVTLQGDSIAGETPVKLIGKQEVLPPQRKFGDRVIMEIPRFSMDPGFYVALSQRDTLGLVAFDLDKKESLLESWSGEEVKSRMGDGKYVSVFAPSADGSFSSEIKERYLGTQLWKLALILALLFLLAEVLLIRFVK